MSGQAEVDVSYRGLSVGAGLRMRDFGPTTAYVELAQPMPVGAQLEVVADGVRFAARVVHVRERTEGGEIGAMRIAVDDIAADARAWWDALVTTEDPAPAPAPPPAQPEPEPEPEVAAAPEPVADDATDAIPEEVSQPEARRTLMMSAADLAEIQSMAAQQSAEEFARREAEAAAAGVDTDNGADNGDTDDDKKKKKRKRNKKKR